MTRWGMVATAAHLLVGPLAAQQGPFRDGTLERGRLSFDGHATLGDFTGVTLEVGGALVGAPALDQVTGWVTAPVSSLRTGNDHRDRDLNTSMATGEYPELRFDLERTEPGTSTADSLPVTLIGRLTLHGVTRHVALPAILTFDAGGVRVQSDFPVNLHDYRIGHLTKMLGMLRMDEHIVVHVDVRFAFPPH
jgi:polyisoprenoid-binding protein YceI